MLDEISLRNFKLVSLEAIPVRAKHPLAPKQGVVEEMLTLFGNVDDDRPTPCQPWPSRRCHVSCDIGVFGGTGGGEGDPDSRDTDSHLLVSWRYPKPQAEGQSIGIPPGTIASPGSRPLGGCVCLLSLVHSRQHFSL